MLEKMLKRIRYDRSLLFMLLLLLIIYYLTES